MENIAVSIIVPVYNVEKYIDKCLSSLVNQTLKNIEIIVVNDGSPDNSQKIIDKYVQNYPEIVFSYIKENGGLGDARNYGIARARGEYIGFVDSDDWVDTKMFSTMYEFAKEENADVVLCDLIEINDGWTTGNISYGYRGNRQTDTITHYEFMLNSLNPAFAWNKLYKRTLFHIKKFPKQWYEDMGCTPILLSYANKIAYLPIALYYYRQNIFSITKVSNDDRILKVIDSWQACLNDVKREHLEPMEAAIYKSIEAFIRFKPKYAEAFLEYAKVNKDRFLNNLVIQGWIKNKEVCDLFEFVLIPKKIHYFWFGENNKSELIERCIASWEKYAPDFEIIEWNETNCDMNVNPYVEQAYKAKKWAFVTDYFRMEKIAEHGGIYLDTDMELMSDPSVLLLDPAFFAFETKNAVHAGAFGAIPNHPIITQCKNSYKKDKFKNKDGTYNTDFTIVRRITQQLEKYGLELNGREQVLKDEIRIYPANKLTLDMFDGEIIAQHHYDASWWDVKTGLKSYKYDVLKDFFSSSNPIKDDFSEIVFQRDYYKSEYERLENSTCWRITKPVRVIGDLLKKLLGDSK